MKNPASDTRPAAGCPSSVEIVHLDLSREIDTLERPRGGGHVMVVLWWKDRPLGEMEISERRLPMGVQEIWRRAAAAVVPEHARDTMAACRGAVEAHAERVCTVQGPPPLSVSVAVCTHNRPAALERCLGALHRLTYRPAEIIIVDNAPESDATRRTAARFPDVAYVEEPRKGLDAARNAAIRFASGEIIAFTDDDVIVHRNWLAGLVSGFADPRVMATTGLVLPAELCTESQILFERYWGFNRGYATLHFAPGFVRGGPLRPAPIWKIGAGASMAFRRSLFDRLGGFDERLDAGAAGCSGDSEMWYRILAADGHCRYDPSSVAFHAHRRSTGALKRQLFFYMRGHTASHLVQFERHGHFSNLFRLLMAMPTSYLKLSAEAIARGFQGRYATLPHEIAGYLAGFPYFLIHRNRAGWIGDGSTTLRQEPSERIGVADAATATASEVVHAG